jgi:hypothetical protein
LSDYRLDFVDADGQVGRTVILVCENDQQASRAAEDFADGRAMALTEGGRLVAKFPVELSLQLSRQR